MLQYFKNRKIQRNKNKCYFSSLYPFSKQWDKKLNELLDKGKVVGLSQHCLDIKYNDNVYSVWVASYPYGYGKLFSFNSIYLDSAVYMSVSIATVDRLYQFIKECPLSIANQHKKMLEIAGCL